MPTPGIYGWCHRNRNGSVVHRIEEPLRVARDGGVNAATGYVLDDAVAEQYDTILVQMLHEPRATEAWRKLAAQDRHRLVVDIDDMMWAPDWKVFKDHYDSETLQRLFKNIMYAHVVTTPSEYIAESLKHLNSNIHVVPNTVPAYVLDIEPQTRERITVGYQGSPSHLRDFPESQRLAVMRAILQHGWDFHMYGPEALPDGWARFNELHGPDRVRVTGWQEHGPAYYRSLSMDIGIGPLKPTRFNLAKSSLRAIEYAALGIVAVLPDLPIYRGWVVDGLSGLLIKSHQTLRGRLAEIAKQPDWLVAASREARALAETWTTEHNIERWVDAWGSQ